MTDHPPAEDPSDRPFRRLERISSRPGLVIVAAALILVADHLVLGPYSYLEWHDMGDSHVSFYMTLADTVGRYGIYYWFPYIGSGLDILSNNLRMVEVFTIGFVLLPDWLVMAVMRLAQYVLAGWFTYRLCRDHLALGATASLAGGLFHLLLQKNLLEFYFGYGALPLMAWALERLYRRAGWTAWAGAALLGAAYSLSATANLVLIFTIPGIFAWLVLVRRILDWRLTALFCVFAAVCALAQADMLVAMLLNAPLSQRAQYSLDTVRESFLLSDNIIRLLPLIALSLAAAVLARRRDATPSVIVAIVVAIFAVVELTDVLRGVAASLVDVLRGFKFDRFKHLLPFFLSVGAAWGLHELWRLGERAPSARRGTLAGAVLLAALLPVAWPAAKEMVRNARDWVVWGSFTANYASPDIEAVAREYRASEQPFRVVTVQENGLQAGFVNAYGLEAADGYTGMIPYHYRRFWNLATEPFLLRNHDQKWTDPDTSNRLGLLTDDGHGLTIRAADYFRTDLLGLANVRYLLSTVPIESPDLEALPGTVPERPWDALSSTEKVRLRLGENFTGRRVTVYRNRKALPRWFLAEGLAFYADDAGFEALMAQTPAPELARTAVFAEEHRAAFAGRAPGTGTGTIAVGTYSPDRIVLEVTADSPRVLVLSNTFSPFWRATVDGARRTILPAYGTFWGLPLAPGRHTVTFRYAPPYALF